MFEFEFDACVIESETQEVVFCGLLLGDDPRTSYFLDLVQQEIQALLGSAHLSRHRYRSGTEAQGRWITDRAAKKTTIRQCSDERMKMYVVEEDGELVTAFQVNHNIDLLRYVFHVLLDSYGSICYKVALGYPILLPEGFPAPQSIQA